MSSRSIAATVPRTRVSSAVRKPTRGISSRLASSSLLPKLCVKVLRHEASFSFAIAAKMRFSLGLARSTPDPTLRWIKTQR
jgi:hypothetical protein